MFLPKGRPMIIQSRQDIEAGKTYISITLTPDDLRRLGENKVIAIEDIHLQCQIVIEE